MDKVLRVLGVTRVEKDSIEFKWGYLAKGWTFALKVNRGGYFDTRYSVMIGLIFGYIVIYLPWRTSLGEGCVMPQYGIAIHNSTFWVYLGGKFDKSWGQVTQAKWFTWNLPWFTWEFDKREVINKNKAYQIVKDSSEAEEIALIEEYPYKYTLRNGEVQERTATIYQEKRQWHRKWFPLIKLERVEVSIEFSDEVGERTGSWKGGVCGCGYDMLKGETPLETLRRMEVERVFK